MPVIESQRSQPSLGASQATDPANHFAPPRSSVELEVGSGKLLPHQKAGRVIRLMAWLAVLGTVGIGAAVLLPALSTGGGLPFELVILLGLFAALVVGLFFVAGAVLRHRTWGRFAGIAYGLIALAGFPIGTIVGLYVLWKTAQGSKAASLCLGALLTMSAIAHLRGAVITWFSDPAGAVVSAVVGLYLSALVVFTFFSSSMRHLSAQRLNARNAPRDAKRETRDQPR